MSSGVGVNSECLTVFQELKLKKMHKYIIFVLNKNHTEIIVEKISASIEYDDFLNDLPENQPRYAVYDFEFEKEGEGIRNKIVFIAWNPDTAKVREKMLYTSSKDALRRSLVGVAMEVQATDSYEISYESLLEKV